jgi:hypothetical protein
MLKGRHAYALGFPDRWISADHGGDPRLFALIAKQYLITHGGFRGGSKSRIEEAKNLTAGTPIESG